MGRMLMGSRYFFSQYPDFNSKDIDEIEIVTTNRFQYMSHLRGKESCLFSLRKLSCAQDYIDYALTSNLGMVVGKFLIPEFVHEIGMSIEDLPQLQPLIDILDAKHMYEKIIFDSYIKNGDFFLTDTQRDLAYASYKNSRKTN